MEFSSKTHQNRTLQLPPTVTLALWRLRRTSLMLLVTGVGMIAAVILICAVPLFSQVALTAGLRGILDASPGSSNIYLNIPSQLVTTTSLHTFEQQIALPTQNSLGQYLSTPPEFSLQTPGFTLLSPHLNPSRGFDSIQLYGTAPDHASTHLTLSAGRLPRPTSNIVEVAITPDTASELHLHLGSTMTTRLNLNTQEQAASIGATAELKLTVVGLFIPNRGNDPFWHDNDFRSTPTGQFTTYKALAANDALLHAFTQLTESNQYYFVDTPSFIWAYHLDASRVSADQVNDLINALSTLQTHIANASSIPYIQNASVSGSMLASLNSASPLEKYRDHMNVVLIPVMILSIQVVALVLFFVAMMTELLVDRQSEAIAILRSRGASRQQVFGSLVAQSVGMGLLALLVGPPLAVLVVYLVAQHTLLPQDQGSLNVIASWHTLLSLRWYALAAALVSVIAMIISLYRVTGMDVLSMRREAARMRYRPLWQRLYLDIIAAIIALTGYVMSQYVLRSGALDPQTNILLAAPLALIAPLFLVIAGVLLFLRIFPLILRSSAWLAVYSRGAVPMLALAQMARTPGQFIRMTLLLAFATAFAIFSLVFSASQTRHTLDIATYLTAADFSGSIATPPTHPLTLAQQTTLYRHIPGVTAATLAYKDDATAIDNLQIINLSVSAVDPGTFAQTVLWTDPHEQQALAPLMKQLAAQRFFLPSTKINPNDLPPIPAIVDASLWDTLALNPGSHFELTLPSATLTFTAIGQVQHIPQQLDSTDPNATSTTGGILIDYDMYVSVYKKALNIDLSPNYVWLRTQQDATSLTSVRTALSKGPLQLSPLYDRQAFAGTLYTDPLYLDLNGILTIGAFTTLLLALLGDLLASWLSARTRLANFAILRALGTAPWQVASVLTWEQCIVYSTAIFLGILFGLFLSLTVVPSLVFTSVPNSIGDQISSAQFYILQHIIPVQVTFPQSLGIILIALLLICVIALGMMVRVVSKPSMSQTLRLNSD